MMPKASTLLLFCFDFAFALLFRFHWD